MRRPGGSGEWADRTRRRSGPQQPWWFARGLKSQRLPRPVSLGVRLHGSGCFLMHCPTDGVPLPFPVRLKPFIVGGFRATRSEMRSALGEPHFVETDSTRTFGGDEDMWAWELPSGQRFLLVLQVPYGLLQILCDPPEPQAVIAALGVEPEKQQLEILAVPVVAPGYGGP